MVKEPRIGVKGAFNHPSYRLMDYSRLVHFNEFFYI